MTAADLAAYVSPGAALGAPVLAFVGKCWGEAEALVSQRIGGATVPPVIKERATLEVGAELFHRRQAPNGIAQFATPDGGGAMRVSRDPMAAANAILAPFVGRGIA
ncbi:hypothetical protein LQ938_09695 [Microbacterium sp. cx-55]|uniref:hypothetical protein n=1 Tax=Microbacterium sp. cx-55 TaxID=2875948 RepID=UPI001CBFB2C4|nr:hypothetical protein [Microbacterium sp. cx-55]MBZ4485966.1 hypothetical protein [Microbacterium sp. cx-55]UGB34160.1 hypothetical protein LQ938_09695 [Microbacterium sp. cx-55]